MSDEKKPYKFIPDTFMFLVPAICDTCASTLYNLGLQYVDASIYQMLRNCVVLFVAILSSILWKDYRRKFDLPQLVGLTLILAGEFIISYAAVSMNG